MENRLKIGAMVRTSCWPDVGRVAKVVEFAPPVMLDSCSEAAVWIEFGDGEREMWMEEMLEGISDYCSRCGRVIPFGETMALASDGAKWCMECA